jgi:hypothetical protein
VDIGRDLIDHRIVDLGGHDVGRVDNLWVYPGADARIGPIVTGAAALFGQFGAVGQTLLRIAPRLGYRHAQRWRELGWNDVADLQRPQVVIRPRASDMAGRPQGHEPRTDTELLYTTLIHLPVCDSTGHSIGIVDLRTTLPDPEPRLLGLLVAAHPLRHTLGLKRFDSTGERFAGTRRDTRFLPWSDISEITEEAIHTQRPLTDLPLLSAAPASVPPPMPRQADTP